MLFGAALFWGTGTVHFSCKLARMSRDILSYHHTLRSKEQSQKSSALVFGYLGVFVPSGLRIVSPWLHLRPFGIKSIHTTLLLLAEQAFQRIVPSETFITPLKKFDWTLS